ncbi:MAG TPA: GIY-YIG nuclease family protein [Saprospiraceae bacterium]|nr:GIY-YIG nuclease family protein [Saprospiraceae bacterium]
MKSKKELQEEYKQLKFRIGVFQIRNTVNNKILVEGSVNLDAIWNRHRSSLRFGGHTVEKLQKDWNEYGEDQFCFEVLAEIDQEDTSIKDYRKEVKKLEEMFVEELQPFGDKGYNRVKSEQ